ncbi:MAG: hypothetical protein WCN88_04775 [Candidatus Falkowbacteria bacterium]
MIEKFIPIPDRLDAIEEKIDALIKFMLAKEYEVIEDVFTSRAKLESLIRN